MILRKDRNLLTSRRNGGGGCMILFRNNLNVTRAPEYEILSNNEDLWARVRLCNGMELLICVVYLRPETTYEEYKIFFEHIESVVNSQRNNVSVVITGDFNIPAINWQMVRNVVIPIEYEARVADSLISTLECAALLQLNNQFNARHRLLDLVLSNVPRISVHTPLTPLARIESHHPPIDIILQVKPVQYSQFTNFKRYNFRRDQHGN